MSTLVGTERLGRSCVAIVQRGNTEAIRYLRESFDSRDVLEVRWDVRAADRRTVGQGVLPERRRRQRRRRPPATWNAHGFVLVPLDGGLATAAPRVEDPLAEPAGGDAAGRRPAAMPSGVPPADARVLRPVAQAPVPAAEALPAPAGPSATPAELALLAGVVVLVRAGAVVLPSFYDPLAGGWRCGRCDAVMTVRRVDDRIPRAGDACTACQAEVVRVLRRAWQRVDWLRLAAVVGVAYLAVRVVWPLVSRML